MGADLGLSSAASPSSLLQLLSVLMQDELISTIPAPIIDMDIDVTTTSCLNMCDTPLSFALQGPQKATYLFTGADPETDTQDMLGLLRLYADAPDGWITEAQAAGRLRLCLQGRVPKL